MALKLILGGVNSNRAKLLEEELVAAVHRHQPALLVPSSSDVRLWRRRLAGRGVLGSSVATLDAWIDAQWTLHGDGRRMVGPAARAAILSDLAEHTDTHQLGISVSTPGFVDLVADLGKRLSGPITVCPPGAAGGIARMLSDYQERLGDAGLIEAASATRLLSESRINLPGPLVIDGFTDFSDEQQALITSLAATSDVIVGLLWEAQRCATEALTPLVNRFIDAGASQQLAEQVPPQTPIARLEAALFEETEPVSTADGPVFGEAAGAEAECALIARAAKEAIQTATPTGVAVVLRQFDARLPVLTAALRTEAVPFALDVSLPFAKIPFGRAVEALTDAAALRGDTRERALAFLTSPYAGLDYAKVAALDARWRQKRLQGREIVESMEGAAELRVLVGLAKKLVRADVDERTAPDWKKVADILLKNAEACREDRAIDVARDAAGHRALLNAVSEVISVPGASEADLRRALRSVRVAVVEGDGDGVLVTEAHRLRGLRFDTVVLGGLTAREFSPVSRDSLVSTLCAQLGLSRPGDSALAERMLFHGVVSAATDRLVMTRQAVDERGEAIRPSTFWDEVIDLYRTHEDALEDKWPDGLRREHLSLADLASAAPAYQPARATLRRSIPIEAPIPPARGSLSIERALSEMASRDEFSVSEVEKYVSCPYQWFYDRILRPQDIDTAVDSRERGTLAHAALAGFYKRWQQLDRGRVLPGQLDDAMGLMNEVLEELARDSRVVAVTLADRMALAKAGEWARGILRDDVDYLVGFTPRYHELRFGERHGCRVEIGGVALTGSIDRVDVSADGLFVTDYKSSATPDGRANFASKGKLQIPVYAAVAEKLTGLHVLGGVYRSFRSLAARGFWDEARVELGTRGTGTDRCTQADVESDVKSAIALLASAVSHMKAGVIEPNPLGQDVCDHCGARHACGKVV